MNDKGIEGLRKTVLEFASMLEIDVVVIKEEVNKMDKKTLIKKFIEMKELLVTGENLRLIDILIQNCRRSHNEN
jgi:hypothetical protein